MSSMDWIQRCGLAGMIGGLLWMLWPLGNSFAGDTRPGMPADVAVAGMDWLLAVAPLLLFLVGLAGLRSLYGRGFGRFGKAGLIVSFVAVASMFAGNATEVASLTFAGSESAVGHFAFLIGFLLSLIGSALLGMALVRIRRGFASRFGGLLLVLALPLGILLAVLGGIVSPEPTSGSGRRSPSRTASRGCCWDTRSRLRGTERPCPRASRKCLRDCRKGGENVESLGRKQLSPDGGRAVHDHSPSRPRRRYIRSASRKGPTIGSSRPWQEITDSGWARLSWACSRRYCSRLPWSA